MQYLEDVVNIQSILTMVFFLTIKSQPCVQEVARQLQSVTKLLRHCTQIG